MPAQHLHRVDEVGIFSHVYNRGVEARTIFKDAQDFETFIGFLKDYTSAPQHGESTKQEFQIHGRTYRGTPHQPNNYFGKVELLAYSLKPDHFHLLLHQTSHNAIQGLIRSLCTRYSIYFNKKYQRTGSLFAGPYKSVEIPVEALPLVASYINQTVEHSSLSQYLEPGTQPWINQRVVLKMKHGAWRYAEFLESFGLGPDEQQMLKQLTLDNDPVVENANPAEPVAESRPTFFADFSLDSLETAEPIADDPEGEQSYTEVVLGPLQRLPELFGVIAIFLLLLVIGVTNIRAAGNKSEPIYKPVTSSQPIVKPALQAEVGIRDEVQSHHLQPAPATDSASLTTASGSASLQTEASASAAIPPHPARVRIMKGVDRINIYQQASTESAVLTTATAGDTFDFIAVQDEWYQIKLADDTPGYLPVSDIESGGSN